jgi:hypothetical protein
VSALHTSPPAPGAFLCPRCGSALRPDQDWCLDCGYAARTRIHPPPGWRAPIVATFLLTALLAAAIAFGLAALLDEEQTRPAASTVTTATAPTTPAPSATTPTTLTPTTTTPGATVPGASTTPTNPTTVTPATVVPSPRTRIPTTPGGAIPRPTTP